MQLIFANPLGWWALLLLPALVLIHCLHRTRQPVIISTLFLVQDGASERRGGRKFVFWKHSVAFWLQVLTALLLTWLLLQPRWIGSHTEQKIALVLDSSLSMEAFLPAMQEALAKQTRSLTATSARTDWLLMESDPRAPILYRGTERDALLRAAAKWQPRLGSHDWTSATRTASALVGTQGSVIFVTDHQPENRPHGIAVLGVGTALDNVGFAGLQVLKHGEETVWRTLLRNYSNSPVSRQWWLESASGERTEPRTAKLPADGSLALSGIIPPGVDALTLVLEDDAWPIDNRLPLLRPRQKQISYRIEAQSGDNTLRSLLNSLGDSSEITAGNATGIGSADSAAQSESSAARPTTTIQSESSATQRATTTTQSLTATTEQSSTTTAQPTAIATQSADRPLAEARSTLLPTDLLLAESVDLQRKADGPPARSQILFLPRQSNNNQPVTLPTGQISSEEHPLNDGLNWNGLTLQNPPLSHQLAAGETPLLWLGQTPLIWLREHAAGHDLVFNFSLSGSNAFKLPATVLLIKRFAEELRAAKPAYEAINVELGQRLRLALPVGTREVRINGEAVKTTHSSGTAPAPLVIYAPSRPGLLEVTAGGEPLLHAAAHFADVREADLRTAASFSDLDVLEQQLIETSSEADPHQAWWLLLLAAAMLASWYYAERGR